MDASDGAPILSRKAKATSAVLANEVLQEPTLPPVRRKQTDSRRNHNSLPADLAYSFEEETCRLQQDDSKSFPVCRITAFRKELDLLKGCVSECRTIFSPSANLDFTLLENFTSSKTRPPPLPVDEPFKILSSSSHIVLPTEEFSIQVPSVGHVSDKEHLSVLEKIDTEFSISDLDVFSDDTFYDAADSDPPNQSHDTTSSQSPPPSSPSHLKALTRQGSLEYDHLEPGHEEQLWRGTKEVANNYSVTVQFHDVLNSTECTNLKDKRKVSYTTSVQDDGVLDSTEGGSGNTGMQAANSLLSLNTSKHSQCASRILSLSIPEKLNSLKNSDATVNHGCFQPSEDDLSNKCHCPVCCSCGSSHRQLTDIVGHECKSSHAYNQCDETLSNASWPICPLERYSTKPSSVVLKKKAHIIPAVAVSQGISKRIERVPSGKDTLGNTFGSSVEISHSSSVIEDELEISSNCGNQVYCELDNQSVFSIHSLMSCQSGFTCHSNCSFSQPFNKGVEGSVFKERIEVGNIISTQSICIITCIFILTIGNHHACT